VYLIRPIDKTNAGDLSSGVFTILISVTRMIKITKSIAILEINWQWHKQ